MRYARLFTKLFCRPVLLETRTRVGYEDALISLLHGESLDGRQFAFQRDARKESNSSRQERADSLLEIRGNTALVHIDGTIDKNLSAFEVECFDATDLKDVDQALAQIAASSRIENCMLVINSPGGSVTGVPETAARIAALAKDKNVFAYTEGMMCSAAYWLAAAADQIFATPSADTGSIGVYMALLNRSEAMKKMGVSVELIKDGDLKAAGAPFKPLSEEERAHFQEQVSHIGTLFRSAVNAKRPGVTHETMQGQSFFGAQGLESGLVDALVPDLATALAKF
jgi:protease-4